MSILDLYESGEHKSNVAHFAAIVSLAAVDGEINPEENKVLKQLAFKLDVPEEEYEPILKTPNKYPLIPPYTLEKRFDRFHDLFNIIYADYEIDDAERDLLFKYAIGLGFSKDKAHEEIEKCISVYGSEAEFED
jgi:uncharacterized tellurite resistance protein B-like protein